MNVTRAASVVASVAAACLVDVSAASGQWLKHPTPGIPRTPDGKPHLSAPAPRTREGTPDLSGLWRTSGRLESDFRSSDAQPWAAERAKQLEANVGYDSWAVRCLPPGPMINLRGGPFRIIQTPGITAMLYELPNNFRQVFTDGRGLPTDPNPTWQGYSVGRWEGDTFVVESLGFNDKSTIGQPPHPHSEALRFTERYRRRDFGHIDVQMTVDDPKAFTRVWTMRAELVFAADDELLEFVCNENEKSREHMVAARQTDSPSFTVNVATLRKYVGTYDVKRLNGTVVQVTIALDGDHLTLAQGGRAPAPMVPQSTTMFTSRGGIAVEFVANDRGEINQLIAHAVEGDMTGVRTAPR